MSPRQFPPRVSARNGSRRHGRGRRQQITHTFISYSYGRWLKRDKARHRKCDGRERPGSSRCRMMIMLTAGTASCHMFHYQFGAAARQAATFKSTKRRDYRVLPCSAALSVVRHGTHFWRIAGYISHDDCGSGRARPYRQLTPDDGCCTSRRSAGDYAGAARSPIKVRTCFFSPKCLLFSQASYARQAAGMFWLSRFSTCSLSASVGHYSDYKDKFAARLNLCLGSRRYAEDASYSAQLSGYQQFSSLPRTPPPPSF